MLISSEISELEESCATSLGPSREYPLESSKSKASRLRSESSLSLDFELDCRLKSESSLSLDFELDCFLLKFELDLDLLDFELFEECDLLDYLLDYLTDSVFEITLGSISTGLG